MTPAETHTFLFADLAGYTALTEAHGDEQAADAAADFCDAVRALLPEHDAEEVKAMGDALMVRVPDAPNAAALATRIVRDYGARHQSLGIRVGMHTGTAVRRRGDWFGSAVNIASRVADAADAGQILCTEATARALFAEGALRERGSHSFKNVSEPIALYELMLSPRDVPTLPTDPVCRMAVEPDRAFATRDYRGSVFHFCSRECVNAFDQRPAAYVGEGLH